MVDRSLGPVIPEAKVPTCGQLIIQGSLKHLIWQSGKSFKVLSFQAIQCTTLLAGVPVRETQDLLLHLIHECFTTSAKVAVVLYSTSDKLAQRRANEVAGAERVQVPAKFQKCASSVIGNIFAIPLAAWAIRAQTVNKSVWPRPRSPRSPRWTIHLREKVRGIPYSELCYYGTISRRSCCQEIHIYRRIPKQVIPK